MSNQHKEPMHPTDLELFQLCPEKYWRSKDPSVKRRYVSNALIKGQAMHRWLAKYVAPDVPNYKALAGVQELREIVFAVAEEYNQNEIELAGLVCDLGDLEIMATKVVEYVYEHGIKILHTELTLPYKLCWLKYEDFEGTIDVVAVHPDTPEGMVEIWDYKTGQKFVENVLNRKLQFGHYYIAAGQRGMKVNRVFWAHCQDLIPRQKKSKYGNVGEPKGQFLYPVHISKEDAETIMYWTGDIVAAINADIRYLSPGQLCQACEYNDTCPRFKVGVSSESKNGMRFEANQDKQAELERKLMEESQ